MNMLESKYRTPQEQAQYLAELRQWLSQVREDPAEEMAGFFAKRIDIYDQNHLEHWGREYAHIAEYLDDGLTSLLDLGCGTGLELDSIYRRFPQLQVTGIDLSQAMLDQLRQRFAAQRPTLLCADYFTCPLGQDQFDGALSFESLHHFPYEKKGEIYQRLHRALKPGGAYVECDYVACCQEEEDLCLEGYRFRRAQAAVREDMLVHIDIPLTLEHQLALMKGAGFSTVDVLYENCGTVIFKARK